MKETKIPAQWTEASAEPQDPQDLGIITTMANEAILVERQIVDAEQLLTSLKEKHKRITEIEIPDRMAALGVDSITTTLGHKLTIKPFYQGSIKRIGERGPHDERAFDWLDANGHGGVIKTSVEVEFGRGAKKVAEELVKKLRTAFGDRVSFNQSVHAQTMKALVREIMESGGSLPEQFFNVYSGRVATIKVNRDPITSSSADKLD